jgi:serine protease
MLALTVALVVVAAPVAGGPEREGAPPLTPEATVRFSFRDGGLWRSATRGAVPGTNDAPVDVVYEDPATGRITRGQVGRGAIVAVDADIALDADADSDGDALGAVAAALHVDVVRVLLPTRGLVLVESRDPAEDGLALAQRLAGAVDAGVIDEAFPNLHLRHRLQVTVPPDDPRYAAQFYLHNVDIEGAWGVTLGDPSVSVTVVDNGCDLDHPDLASQFDDDKLHDVVDVDDDPTFAPGEQTNEHGTACAGLIAALTDNNRDIAGACPLCRLGCTRLLAGDGELTPLDADVNAFAFALEDDVDVVSNSWGFVDAIPVPSVLRTAIDEVADAGRGGKGAIVVFAAGNDSRAISDDELLAVDGVFGVGAVNSFGELTQFSNTGPSVDVVAPTGAITTDIAGADGEDPGDVTVRFGGTSSACPIVAGVAALLVAEHPELTREEVYTRLIDTAQQSVLASPDETGHDDEYGFGLVQAGAALAESVKDDDDKDVEGGAGCDCGDGSPAALFAALLLRRRRRTR